MLGDPSVLLVLDLVGTFAFALNGALTAIRAADVDLVGVLTLGLVTAVGGGIIRDVLRTGLYAIPALVAAALVVLASRIGVDRVLGAPAALAAAGVCFTVRMVGLRFRLDAPRPPGTGRTGPS